MSFDSTYNQYIRKDNEDCITIYNLLYKYFLEIEQSIGPKINIISVPGLAGRSRAGLESLSKPLVNP